ncbi:MAG: hypothetical protein H6727_07310 [Myxococcales bacterium]|nr:hypothetical protein [Myxococcales bacterium]
MRTRLLWIDGLAGASVGIAVLLLSHWLTGFYGLPHPLVRAIGAANLLYGLYSTTLAARQSRPLGFIVFLVIANASWSVVCVVLAVLYFKTASFFGMFHICGEGLFVAGLAALEWRWRKDLATT